MKKITLFLFAIFTMSLGLSQTVFGDKQTISTTGSGPYNIASGLVNNDDYPDLLIGAVNDNTLELYINNGSGGFNDKVLISNTLNVINDVKLVDLNGDTHLDVLACGYTSGTIAWYPNDGSGGFDTENIIASSISGAAHIETGTLDGNNTIDIVVSSSLGNEVLWFSNDGLGNFTQGNNVIDNTIQSPARIRLKDIDGDGDQDVLVLSNIFPTGGNPTPNIIELFRNKFVEDGEVLFEKAPNTIGNGKIFLWDARFEDVNDPNNRTIFVTDFGFGSAQGSIYRYDDNGFGYDESIISTSLYNPSAIQLVDLDGDSNKDLLAGSGSNTLESLAWFKNNGSSYNTNEVIDNTQNTVYSLISDDFDLDGDSDIVSLAYGSNMAFYFENLLETLSTPDLTQEEFNFYPNPVTNRLNFSASNMISAKLRISDITGKIVFNNTVELTHGIDVSNLQKGVYVLSVNNTSNYKFVKN